MKFQEIDITGKDIKLSLKTNPPKVLINIKNSKNTGK